MKKVFIKKASKLLPLVLLSVMFFIASPVDAHFTSQETVPISSNGIHPIDILLIFFGLISSGFIFKILRNLRQYKKFFACSLIAVYVFTFLGLCTYVHLFEKDLSSHSIHAKNCFKPNLEKGLEIVQLPPIVTSYEPVEIFTPEAVITPSLITKDIRSPPTSS